MCPRDVSRRVQGTCPQGRATALTPREGAARVGCGRAGASVVLKARTAVRLPPAAANAPDLPRAAEGVGGVKPWNMA